jgi:hypothetical protein
MHDLHDDLESLVLSTACQVLEIDHLELADDFFVRGGDSTGAMHLIGRLSQRVGLRLRVRVIFENPRFDQLVAQIRVLRAAEPSKPSATAGDPLEQLRRSFVTEAAEQRGAS